MSEIRVLADAVVAMVSGMLVKGSGQVICATARIEACASVNGHERCIVGKIRLACYAPSNYVKVFGSFSGRATHAASEAQWVLLANHDSGWRDEGVRAGLLDAHKSVVAFAVQSSGKRASSLEQTLQLQAVGFADADAILGMRSKAVEYGTIDYMGTLQKSEEESNE